MLSLLKRPKIGTYGSYSLVNIFPVSNLLTFPVFCICHIMILLGDCGSHVAGKDVGENERPLSDLQIASIVQFLKQNPGGEQKSPIMTYVPSHDVYGRDICLVLYYRVVILVI